MSEDPVNTLQLHQLLERMEAGDLPAREELLQRCCQRLERLARKMLRSFPHVHRWVETDDVLQNALLRLLRALEKVRPGNVKEFFGLAAMQIRRELLDLARHYYGPQGLGANHATWPTGSTAGKDSDPPDHREDLEDLQRWCEFHQSVETLPVQERQVVELLFYHGWTQPEVGALLEISDRTVRRYWESAMTRLSFVLRDHDSPPPSTPSEEKN